MRAACIALAALALAGGAASCGDVQQPPGAGGDTLSGYGMSIDLPGDWSGRIVLGTHQLPILHAFDFPLPPGDSDWGDEVQEGMGIRGAYLNVQQLAGTRAGAGGLPVAFERSDLRAGSLRRALVYPGHVYARRLVAVDGRGYQVTAVFARTPSGAKLTDANSVLATLRLVPYPPAPVVRAGGRLLHGRGIALRLPAGWRGSISGGIVHATSTGGSRLGPRDLSLDFHEFSSAVGPGWNSPLPVSLGASEFVRPEYVRHPPVESVRYLRAAGRSFRLTAKSGGSPPDPATLEEANAALATLSVRPGDFYPGSVQPARFRPARGWHAGTSGPTRVKPDGEGTFTFASTIPYRDEPNAVPPERTLRHLPPDGIVMIVSLSAPAAVRWPLLHRPPTLVHVHGAFPWEGQVGEIPLYHVGARVGHRYNAEIWIFFGRRHPTSAQLVAANAELRRLELPSWIAATRAVTR